MSDTIVIDIDSFTRQIITCVGNCIDLLKNISFKIGDFSASYWIFIVAFFCIDVIIYALFRGDEIKE